MENSFFVFTDKFYPIEIERFHVCTWEFNNESSLVEFGVEISRQSINSTSLEISIYIPWVNEHCTVDDLYENLSNQENSRFIFNDYLVKSETLDGGRNKLGVIHEFIGRGKLCILPITSIKTEEKIVRLCLNLQHYSKHTDQPNLYFRFSIKPQIPYITTRKNGVGKSTIIYDVKINERRNIPDDKIDFFSDKTLCKIKDCFSFNIIPNKYDIVFFDSASLQNVRTLEFESFNKYLADKRVRKDELLVVFNKKSNLDSFSFFSIYAKERIGAGQFALAVLMNIVCGILLYLPGYRNSFPPQATIGEKVKALPVEIYISSALVLFTIGYFIWPVFRRLISKKG